MPQDTRVPVVWVEDSVRETRSQLDGTPGSAGAERCQKALDTLSVDDVKDDIVSSGACSAPGNSSHVPAGSSNKGDKLPKPTLISSTMYFRTHAPIHVLQSADRRSGRLPYSAWLQGHHLRTRF
ncbi:hypothetical protein OPQ81_010669 [Rhizoctonia solani]|nr:hypothetical protein OPQ81_010669 [Rhizoctonia solani]